MATPASSSDVFNPTLGHLKTDPVISIDPADPGSKAAAAGAKWWDAARRAVLEDHPWQFAKRREQIAAEADAPLFEYSTKYQLPPDFIRVIRLGEKWDDPELDYEIEDGFLLCNVAAPLDLVYVYDITDVTKFSAKFIMALSFKLAQVAGYEITGSQTVVQAMEALYTKEMSTAASVQGQNRPPRRIQRSVLRDARMNFGTARNWRTWGPD